MREGCEVGRKLNTKVLVSTFGALNEERESRHLCEFFLFVLPSILLFESVGATFLPITEIFCMLKELNLAYFRASGKRSLADTKLRLCGQVMLQ